MRKMKTMRMLAFVVVIATMTACGNKEKEAVKADAETAKPTVNIKQVSTRDVEQQYEFTATVEPVVKNSISPAAPGRIRQIFVEVGASVAKGQKLAQMDAANLQNLETQIMNYKRIQERVIELHAVGGASQQELDNAKLQVTVAETNLKNLQENTFLISPITGIVTARNYDNGDMFSGQLPILTIMQINPVKLKINVSEMFFSKVQKGMPVNVKLDVYENESFSGRVSLIYPTIDERTRTFPVEISLANPGNKVRPGMFARVNINFGMLNRVVVPDQAVVKQSGSAARFVYVYDKGKVSFAKVEVGRRMGAEYELVSGVANGAWVVVNGQARLTDGAEVTAQKIK
jgi:RND family efflux transporter MFP subunit